MKIVLWVFQPMIPERRVVRSATLATLPRKRVHPGAWRVPGGCTRRAIEQNVLLALGGSTVTLIRRNVRFAIRRPGTSLKKKRAINASIAAQVGMPTSSFIGAKIAPKEKLAWGAKTIV